MNSIKNSINLIGRLGNDPEFRNLENGNKLVKLTLATKDIYNNLNGEKVIDTQWHKLIAWGKVAENMNVFLKKGNEIALTGKLTHNSFKDDQGRMKYYSEIVVNEFMLLTQSRPKKDA